MKLNDGELHMLRLAAKGAGPDGWAKVSKLVWPMVQRLPGDLVETREDGSGFYVRLTEGGSAVVAYA